tara:strand:+ start:196 stop:489 length:294 start_codon:yes stop_codon:yes gene_type:complete
MAEMISGMLALGNGEKCPYCEHRMVNNRLEGLNLIDHMKKYHYDEFMDQLFPDVKLDGGDSMPNAHAEGSSPDDEMTTYKGLVAGGEGTHQEGAKDD